MKKRLLNILILSILIAFLLLQYIFQFPCLIKQVFGIFCPACGLTRAFYSLINFDIISALKYNILSIPIFILIISFILLVLRDLIKNDNKGISLILNFFKKYYIVIIILLILNMVIKNLGI